MSARLLHPFAWWAWAGALGYAALRTTNLFLLSLIVAVTWLVVAARRPDTPWASGYATFLRLGLFVIAFRVLLEIGFGQRLPGTVLFTTPQLTLPDWAAGTSVGGPVTSASLLNAVAAGLQLAALLACVGAANSLTSPARLLRALPAPFYEVGLVVTVGLSFA
ncbi:MAG: energy-coupling factor transporter transmembrane protein EcfT, partial [Actinomycetota bacterium]